ncbi:hypothetical protein TYRP_012203 [Tyrophagus putrescentiae]|nr:hypothetical protein TYRP_012203 [Tyrophagus putrescentiae]
MALMLCERLLLQAVADLSKQQAPRRKLTAGDLPADGDHQRGRFTSITSGRWRAGCSPDPDPAPDCPVRGPIGLRRRSDRLGRGHRGYRATKAEVEEGAKKAASSEI